MAGIFASFLGSWKAKDTRFSRDYPASPRNFPSHSGHLSDDRLKSGRFPVGTVAGFARNRGRFPSEYPAGIPRNTQITPRSGLVLFAELIRAFKVKQRVERLFPRPGSNRGYEAWSYIEPLLLMMEGGGRHVEDLREIRDDVALRALTGLEEMPSLSTFGDWLARSGAAGGSTALGVVNEEVAGAILSRLAATDYTLDVDTTVIESDKKEAAWT